MDVAKILAKVLDQPQVAKVMRVLDIYGHAAGGLLANGLAFSALFASIPAALLVLGVGGFIAAGSTEAQQKLVDALIEAFPPLADLINGAVTAVSQGAALTSIIGFFGVIWTVSQFYGAIDVAFARIFAASPERDIVRRTARGFLVVVLIGIAIVGFVVLVSAATYLDALIPTQIPVATSIVNVLRSVPFLILLAIGVDPGDLPVPAAERATLAVGADPGDPGRDRRGRPDPDLHAAGPATGRRRRTGGLAGVRVHRACLAVVHVPGGPVWRRVGARPGRACRPRGGRGVSGPGRSRSVDRTERSRRVTARS